MYNSHLKVQPNKNGNSGLFTTVPIPAKTPIIEANGTVLTVAELSNPNDPDILQVGPNTFMCCTGDMVPDHISHSCEPNCYFSVVGNRAILFSLYVIAADTELTFDYSTTSTESPEQWKMDCKCGSFKCRKQISGFQHLDPAVQQFYKDKQILPLYITLPIIQPR